MTGKEALEEVKDAHITKWAETGVYSMIFKDTISYKTLENELENKEKLEKNYDKLKVEIYDVKQENEHLKAELEFTELLETNTKKKLTKYKRAFEILKEKLNIEFGKYDFSVTPNYYKDLEYFADVKSSFDLTKEEKELLEELMKDE